MADRNEDETAPLVAELPDIIGGGAGAALGALVAGMDGAIAGGLAGPGVAAALRYGATALHARRQRAGQALQVAAEALGTDVEAVGERAASDPARLELLARVLEAAGRTPLEEKVHALGRVLAFGLEGHTHVDEAGVLAAALQDIEAPHVQVLKLLDRTASGPSVPDHAGNPVGWLEHEIADALPGRRLVLPALLRTIELHGLTYNATRGTWETVNGETRYALSELGRRCLELLRSAA